MRMKKPADERQSFPFEKLVRKACRHLLRRMLAPTKYTTAQALELLMDPESDGACFDYYYE